MVARSVMSDERWRRYEQKERSFYNDEDIDRAAKILLPWLDSWLASGRTLYDDGFVGEYITRLGAGLGERLIAPQAYLVEMFLFTDERFGESLGSDVRRAWRVSALYAAHGAWDEPGLLDGYTSDPRRNSLFVVHPDSLREMERRKIIAAADGQSIRREYDRRGQALYAAERAPHTFAYVIVADSADEARELIGRLARARAFRSLYDEAAKRR